MELITNPVKYSTLLALLLFTTFSYAAPIFINWKLVTNEERLSTRSFYTEIFTPQDGQRVYSYRLVNREGWRRIGTISSAYRVRGRGDDLISLMVTALQGRRSQNEIREQMVSFEAFPIGWLHSTEELSSVILDRIHFFQNDAVYVNLRPAREGTSLSNTEGQSGSYRAAAAEAGVVNLALDQNPVEPQAPPVAGVILQQIPIGGISDSESDPESQPELFYLLIVTSQALDDDSVSAILNERATGYFYTQLPFDTLYDLINPFFRRPAQGRQATDRPSEISQQEVAVNCLTMLVNYLALLCCYNCLTDIFHK